MEYSDFAVAYLGVMGIATCMVVFALGARLPRESPGYMVPPIGFVTACGMWLAMAPKVGVSHLVGLTALAWVAGAAMALVVGMAHAKLRSRRTVYRRPGGLP